MLDEQERFGLMMCRSAELKVQVGDLLADKVVAVVTACETSLRAGGKLMFCGNGGSASDCQHLSTEMSIRLRAAVVRESLAAIPLGMDVASMSAAANDFGFDRIFERPLRGIGRPGDVLFAISTSGRSPNICRALEAAREMGIVTVGLLGGAGEPAAGFCDHVLLVPDNTTSRVQECHIAIGHALLELLEDRLVPGRLGPNARMNGYGSILANQA